MTLAAGFVPVVVMLESPETTNDSGSHKPVNGATVAGSGTRGADTTELGEFLEQVFDRVVIWEPLSTAVPLNDIVEGMTEVDTAFVSAVYRLAQKLYVNIPLRKNGNDSFAHPTNVAMNLKRARCQPYVVAAGLLHDYIEEKVDLEKAALKVDVAKRIRNEVSSKLNARIKAELTASMAAVDTSEEHEGHAPDRVELARKQVRQNLAAQTRTALSTLEASTLLNDEINHQVVQEMSHVSWADLENAVRGDFGKEINKIVDRCGFPRHVAARVVETGVVAYTSQV